MLAAGSVLIVAAGCALDTSEASRADARSPAASSALSTAPPERGPTSVPPPSVRPTATPVPTGTIMPETPPGPSPSDGKPRDATLTIADLGIENLDVIAYEGWTDDGPGTEIQDGGVAASPYGPRGGVGPGGVGNYQVTAHRLSSTQAFLDLPELDNGDLVEVTADGVTYVYEIVETRETSFRSEESLAAQRAAVPGQPGVEPTQAMITLSTCATPEDHAAGNFWSDEFGNPEHRIDKIGVLIESGPG
ncbi:sortase [Phytoactinopolyspora halotolerans]|uniref:Sortase n=2 Tax=Phytoactinopolyspora halotolerans TaxID=1981512 RepID=A0A6L9SKB0_9ACTN|nr:sortase [Phytoactinopolyspora halotolerans]